MGLACQKQAEGQGQAQGQAVSSKRTEAPMGATGKGGEEVEAGRHQVLSPALLAHGASSRAGPGSITWLKIFAHRPGMCLLHFHCTARGETGICDFPSSLPLLICHLSLCQDPVSSLLALNPGPRISPGPSESCKHLSGSTQKPSTYLISFMGDAS